MKHGSRLSSRLPGLSYRSRDVSGDLLAAFQKLLLDRGYSRISVRLVCSRARVARSTFYECFQSKSDILRQSIQPLFALFAACVYEKRCPDRLPLVLAHMRENGRLSRALLRGPTRELVIGFLADDISATGVAQAPFETTAVAAAQLAILETWLEAGAAAEAADFAKIFFHSSHALARTLKTQGKVA